MTNAGQANCATIRPDTILYIQVAAIHTGVDAIAEEGYDAMSRG
jgi:hypothetical protein